MDLTSEEYEIHSEESWQKRFVRDYGYEASLERPTPVPWRSHYIDKLELNSLRGFNFAKRAIKTINELLEESLTLIQDLVLSNDIETTKYQIEREKLRASDSESEYTFDIMKQNSLTQFAVLNGRYLIFN